MLPLRRGLTPFVGREQEVAILTDRWTKAQESAGQVVLLSGEAGIGKSRLLQVLKDRVDQDNGTRIEFRCSPYHQNSAHYPVIDYFHRFLRFAPSDTPQTKLEKLTHAISDYHLPQVESLPLLAALLSLPHPEHHPALNMSPQRAKQQTLETLLAWLLKEAERQAVLVTVEDVHWTDPSTLELLNLLVEQAPTTRMLALLTFRPEFVPTWTMRALTQITLNRLDQQYVASMAEKVTGGKTLPPEVIQQIASKTDGVPLFVEELTKMVLESGLLQEREKKYELSGPLPSLAIPTTLHDSLMARLDRLNTAKEVAQLGATILGGSLATNCYDQLHPSTRRPSRMDSLN